MGSPLIVRLLLDGQTEFADIVEKLVGSTPSPVAGLNDPAWVVAHTAFFHDCWLNGDAQGRPREEWDRWLLEWADRQRNARPTPVKTDFDAARAAVARIVPRTTDFLSSLTDENLDRVPPYEEGAWPPGTTVGYLVARAVAHLFAHVSELNVLATAGGLPDAGLPGPLALTRMS